MACFHFQDLVLDIGVEGCPLPGRVALTERTPIEALSPSPWCRTTSCPPSWATGRHTTREPNCPSDRGVSTCGLDIPEVAAYTSSIYGSRGGGEGKVSFDMSAGASREGGSQRSVIRDEDEVAVTGTLPPQANSALLLCSAIVAQTLSRSSVATGSGFGYGDETGSGSVGCSGSMPDTSCSAGEGGWTSLFDGNRRLATEGKGLTLLLSMSEPLIYEIVRRKGTFKMQ